MKIHDELKMLRKKWRKSKARNITQPVPDDKYKVKVVDSRIERSKSSNRLQAVQILQIIKGKFKDRMLYRYSGLDTAQNISFIKSDLKLLGIKIPKDIMNLSKALESMIDLECKVEIRTKGEFTNIYFQGLLEEEDDAKDVEDEDNDDSDEDIDEDEEE